MWAGFYLISRGPGGRRREEEEEEEDGADGAVCNRVSLNLWLQFGEEPHVRDAQVSTYI